MLIASEQDVPFELRRSTYVTDLVSGVLAGNKGSKHSARAEILPLVMNACESKGVPYVLFAQPRLGYYLRPYKHFDPKVETWPDQIVYGKIVYEAMPGDIPGFVIRDEAGASHPGLGAVMGGGGQVSVETFNYPSQIEDVTRRLVACWNFCIGLDTDFLEQASKGA